MKAVTIISKVVAFALVLAWQPVSAAVAVPLSGSGTESDPYKIMSAGDWNALAAYMDDSGDSMGGQSIELGADLDFSHTAFSPVGEFDGIFDGAGHRISGIEYNVTATRQGVFGRLMQNGSIRNLTLQGKVVSAHNYTAAFAGVVSGTIENCVNEIDVTASASYTAGFAGQADAGARFVNCVNKGEISSSGSYVAGIVAAGGAGVTYSRCVNDGVVDNTGLGSYTAGIVAVSLPSSFDRCINSGEIVIANTAKAQCVAGILAWANNVKGASDDTFEFSGCENDAYINAAGIVAGIVGDVTLEGSGTVTNGVVLNMEDCIN
ncbi:MAG: hypothetical protein K2L49_04555, partial [Muribaculaceae bacterium]|nr:hypothetical protein [Muribaculaceae bacterium]